MKGSCNCGTVSFEVTSQVAGLYQCHCKLCQKQSGSTSNTATIIDKSDFKWLSGEDSITHWQKDTGFSSHFCKQCGCPVPNALRTMPFMWIPMGLVENADLNIIAHLCCDSKAPWDIVTSGATGSAVDSAIEYEEMPENLEAFIKTLQHG